LSTHPQINRDSRWPHFYVLTAIKLNAKIADQVLALAFEKKKTRLATFYIFCIQDCEKLKWLAFSSKHVELEQVYLEYIV